MTFSLSDSEIGKFCIINYFHQINEKYTWKNKCSSKKTHRMAKGKVLNRIYYKRLIFTKRYVSDTEIMSWYI